MVLKKDLALYERDQKGELIPQERVLKLSKKDELDYPEIVGQTVYITPLTRGELKSLFGLDDKGADSKPDSDKDVDADIIVAHCFNPKFSLDELAFAKPVIIRSVVNTILEQSGVKINDNKREVDKDVDDFGKN